ncbi:tRNA pseudouridine(55) synthase TruB [Leptospira langatensis]|uniref:tRNA pseudouridine synthase B n=1 Tax=Leptospira langatensis TaxID=2484983 RepID=A0A5F1ZQQ2_9LEPT|nr:tRNA pseudouridine(55) synthase TruB [Leptospira langatensis]TGK05270.1 tRNA pseudouridine(55) synthase TruB [Leptospira langatensis]TGL38406.1 tRNA pseudouridine(55) synthase TruB [Leptospira langatensis]
MNPSDLQENRQIRTELGFLLLDKPVGMTSSDLVLKAKKNLGLRKVGHTGTLDKAASGLMVLPIGTSTSFSQFFLGKDKEYVAQVQLGFATDSGDREGLVLEDWEIPRIQKWFEESKSRLEEVLAQVPSWEEQVAPEVSALKVGGQRRAKLFREGVSVPPSIRKIKIFEFEAYDLCPEGFTIKARVSGGTYIRKLVIDIGEACGIPMSLRALNRTKVGKLVLDQADTYEALLLGKVTIHPPEEILDIPSVEIPSTEVKDVFHGKKIRLDWIPAQEFLLTSPEGEILAYCRRDGLPGSLSYKYLKVFSKI